VYRFVEQQKALHHVATMCRVLGVSPSGYWAWRSRGPSARSISDAALLAAIRLAYVRSRRSYGAPRITAELQAAGVRVGHKRVARLMRAANLVGVHRRRHPVRTAAQRDGSTVAPDLVRRHFRAAAPDRLWVADITYLPTAAGFAYLATIIDAWSRRVVGWSIDSRQRAELVIAAIDAAIASRLPGPGLVHHSDRGTQYTSVAVGAHLQAAGIAASMGTPGGAYDNAMAESFFASLETELIDRSSWLTIEAARSAVFDYIEIFYNRTRRHSALGNLSPAEFERRYRSATTAA
jgi:putative transposase